MTEGSTLLQFFDTFGSLGVMGAMVWMFMKGMLVPRPIVDEMLRQEKEEKEYLKEEILKRLESKNA